MKLYAAYRTRKVYEDGGWLSNEEGSKGASAAGIVSSVGPMAASFVSSLGKTDPMTGRKTIGNQAASSALNGAAMGAQAGPIGALVGGVIGAGVGILKGAKERKVLRAQMEGDARDKLAMDRQMSSAAIAGDPTLVDGYRGASYFAGGGSLSGGGGTNPAKPSPADLEKVNADARSFALRRGLLTGAATHTGGAIPKVTLDGKEIPYGTPMLEPVKKYAPVPKDVTEFTYAGGVATYTDPRTGDLVEFSPSDINLPQFHKKAASFAHGGTVTAPLARLFASGGSAKPLSSDTAVLKGAAHEQGGIDLPQIGAEVEGGETSAGDYIFSRRLGFAQQHKPIATAKGVIEGKPPTRERIASLKRLNAREGGLKLRQEYLKHQLGIN